MDEIYFALCKSVDTPVSLGQWLRYKYGEHKQLSEFMPLPSNYLLARAFDKDYLVSKFLSKWKGLKTGLNLEDVAVQKFVTSEQKCLDTNRRIRHSALEGFDSFTESVIFTAQRKIARLLGKLKSDKVFWGSDWGPGATLSIPRRRAFVDTKMTELPITVTVTALPYARAVIEDDLHWSSAILHVPVDDILGPFCLTANCFEVVDYARMSTVPKDARSDRSILVEPTMNGFLQKGAGAFIRRVLKSVGVDLNDQSQNQNLARRAIEWLLATIDLKSASDSVARELVFLLLPFEWASYLDRLRSPKWRSKSQVVSLGLEKFSSMGNGFTFELESLIFWAITSSVTELRGSNAVVSVYGDDIICGQDVAGDVVTVLETLGFEVNLEKSYLDGEFFESCGRHYFAGREVTPIYQKELIDDYEEAIRLANRIIRRAGRGRRRRFDDLLRAPWAAAKRRVEKFTDYETRIPYGGEGDDGLVLPREAFGRVPYDRNYGLKCPVVARRRRTLPACETSLLQQNLKRTPPSYHREVSLKGSLSNSFLSAVDIDLSSGGRVSIEEDKLHQSWRWVVPTREFDLTW